MIAAKSLRLPCAVALALAALLAGASPVRAAEVIHSYLSEVSVAKDGELTVTESIRVRAEGRQIKRGIYRDLPLSFTDAEGRLHNVTFKLLGVFRDGRPEPYHTQGGRGRIRIYAGDKDVIIPRGDHTYVFRYRTGRQIRWFDGKPELNWNVTGNFWNFPITRASYRLHLADGARPVRWTAFTGKRGARGTDWQGAIESDGTLVVQTTRPLAPAEGLTVVAELPGSAVERPSQAQELWWSILDNRHWIVGVFGFLAVLIYYLAAWSAVGRDPKRGVVIPLFHPPAGISPALANYINDWGFGRNKWRAFTAACLSLAVKGLMRFDDSGGKLKLSMTGKEPEGGFGQLPPGEHAVVTWVRGRGGKATIDKASGASVAKVGDNFTKGIEGENKHRFFKRNIGYVIAGLAMTAVAVVLIVIFGALSESDIFILFVTAFGGFWLGIFIVPTLIAVFGGNMFANLVRVAMTVVVLTMFGSFVAVFVRDTFPNGFGDALPAVWRFVSGYPFPFVLIGSFAALNGIFIYLMRAPTALGRPIMDQLAGFKLYLETAEKERLNYQAPEITAERFEALLPYAVALDVEKPWADAFSAAIARAYPGEAEPMNHYHPTWTGGSSSWSTAAFSGAVASTVGSVSSAFASAVPVSSGSSGFSGGGGGGGGSGGGGGGGGGGGW